MADELTVTFPGGKKVNAEYGGRVIATDQPVQDGGEGTAPAPFELFLASLGTCAGIYVLSFCKSRNLPTEGMKLTQRMDWDPVTGALKGVELDIQVPPGFPEKYREAVIRSASMCAVKKAIQAQPEIRVRTS